MTDNPSLAPGADGTKAPQDTIIRLAIEFHKTVEGEYGCNGATCPGVQRLAQAFAALKGIGLAERLSASASPEAHQYRLQQSASPEAAHPKDATTIDRNSLRRFASKLIAISTCKGHIPDVELETRIVDQLVDFFTPDPEDAPEAAHQDKEQHAAEFIDVVGAAFDESTGCERQDGRHADLWCYWPNSDPTKACDACQQLKRAIDKYARRGAPEAVSVPQDDWIVRVIRRVAELPDRTSPDDWPDAMLVTADELRAILGEACPDMKQRSFDLKEGYESQHARAEAAERANVSAQQKTLQLEQDVAALRATQAAVLRLAKEATNGWAWYAKRKAEHDEISRLHREIAKLEGAS